MAALATVVANKSGDSGSGGDNCSLDSSRCAAADVAVFALLESLSLLGLVGNALLLLVIALYRYLRKPSFVLIFSMALADLIHSIVTGAYFHPAILTRRNAWPYAVYRFWNGLDWTAWGVTLSHMISISLDRLVALVLCHSYAHIITVRRYLLFSVSCWCLFAALNLLFSLMDLCCAIVPTPEFYTFDFESPSPGQASFNAYKALYIPIEVLSLCELALVSPVTLLRLYQRYRRKLDMRRASKILRDVGESLATNKPFRPANEQAFMRELKVFIQILAVTLIFFAYMLNYYLFFYLVGMSDKWATMFNSIFYSVTHCINPCVYFYLNDQMRTHFFHLLRSIVAKLCPQALAKQLAPPGGAAAAETGSITEHTALLSRLSTSLASGMNYMRSLRWQQQSSSSHSHSNNVNELGVNYVNYAPAFLLQPHQHTTSSDAGDDEDGSYEQANDNEYDSWSAFPQHVQWISIDGIARLYELPARGGADTHSDILL